MTRYTVRSTDRTRERTIEADRHMDAAAAFLGQRRATLKLNCWALDRSGHEKEWHFDASVKVGPGPFRWNRDAAKSVSVFVVLAHA